MFPLRLVNNTGYESEKNLCFVNTALQLLYSIAEFRNIFKNQVFNTNVNISFPICNELSRIFRTEGNFPTSAAELRRLVGLFSGVEEISDGAQKDISHFLRLLLQTLEIELSEQSPDIFAIINKFWGKEKTTRKFLNTADGACGICHNLPRIEEENFCILKLNIMQHVNQIMLTSLIENYYSESLETIDMKCSACCPHSSHCPQLGSCRLRKAVNQRVLARSPSFLIVQLLRFQNYSNLKLKTKVVSENEITLPNLQKYELISIGDHLGPEIQNGHYVASIKQGNIWYRCNDQDIYNFESNNINTEHNYIFVYRKVTVPLIPEFIPTAEWKEVLPGQAIPGQCEASLNMSTGKNFARKLQHNEVNQTGKTKSMNSKMSDIGKINDTEKVIENKMENTKKDDTRRCKSSNQSIDNLQDRSTERTCDEALHKWTKIEKNKKRKTQNKDLKTKEEKRKILCRSCKKEFINLNLHLKKSFSCLPSYSLTEGNQKAAESHEEEIIPKKKQLDKTNRNGMQIEEGNSEKIVSKKQN